MTKSKTKIDKQSQRKNNSSLVETIRTAKKSGSDFWIGVASVLASPRRQHVALNLNEIDRNTKEGDSIVVPGKVLSQGDISKKVAIIAFAFSGKTKEKLLKTKSHATNIIDEIKKNPEAKGLKILGK